MKDRRLQDPRLKRRASIVRSFFRGCLKNDAKAGTFFRKVRARGKRMVRLTDFSFAPSAPGRVGNASLPFLRQSLRLMRPFSCSALIPEGSKKLARWSQTPGLSWTNHIRSRQGSQKAPKPRVMQSRLAPLPGCIRRKNLLSRGFLNPGLISTIPPGFILLPLPQFLQWFSALQLFPSAESQGTL
jgi:hypothetical protein